MGSLAQQDWGKRRASESEHPYRQFCLQDWSKRRASASEHPDVWSSSDHEPPNAVSTNHHFTGKNEIVYF